MASARPIEWSALELLDAQRRKRKLRTTTQGMRGVVNEVRETDVVMTLDFGATAYMQRSAIAEAPPSSFAAGDRVTAGYFGRARVQHVRAELARVDVVVDLLDCRLAGGENATAYLAPDAVSRRGVDDRTFEEMVEDSAVFRNAGNNAFKDKEYEAALVEYRKVLDVFSYLPRALTMEQRNAVRDGVVKALSNAAQCYLSKAPADHDLARQQCTHALEIDPANITGQREKLLFRRAQALAGLGEWDAAALDLADPSLVGNEPARAKLQQVKDSARKEKDKNKKMWGNAFKKAATTTDEKDADVTEGAEGTTSAPGTPARNGVRFAATPEAGRSTLTGGTPTPSSGSSPEDKGRRADAGRTPFPTKRSTGKVEEEEEEEEEESGEGTLEAQADEEETEGGLFTNPYAVTAGLALLGGAAYLAYRAMRR